MPVKSCDEGRERWEMFITKIEKDDRKVEETEKED